MHWIIKCAAPTDSRLRKWGDFHFARCLSKYLTRLGDKVTTHYQPDWRSDENADVVLVLRGKYAYERHGPSRVAVHILWNISHPADVSIEEYASYELVCVASKQHADSIRPRVKCPVHPLLQCTDLEEFYPARGGEARRGFVFVGNTRSVRRDLVIWAVELGLPLQVWGRGWKEFIPKSHVVADYIANEELGQLYTRARVTFNDHWDDMREYGFINNRVFDALACGLVVVSDRHDALQALFPEEILYCGSKQDLEDALERVMLEYPALLDRVAKTYGLIARDFSFESRARELRALAEGCSKQNAPAVHAVGRDRRRPAEQDGS